MSAVVVLELRRVDDAERLAAERLRAADRQQSYDDSDQTVERILTWLRESS